MSTNSLLSSLYNMNHSPNSRSSSMFTKNLSFLSSNTNLINCDKQKNRSISTAKTIKYQFSTQNDILKWTPLIKFIHKLGSKIKKQYFFFWCRIEALVKMRNKIDQNSKQKMNFLDNMKPQSIHNEKKLLQSKEPRKQIKNIQSRQNFIGSSKGKSCIHIPNWIEQKQQTILILKSKDTIVEEFLTNITVIEDRICSNYSKAFAFKQIKKSTTKINFIQMLSRIQFTHYNSQLKYDAMKKIKNNSHRFIKLDLLTNLYHSLKNSKLALGILALRKFNQQKQPDFKRQNIDLNFELSAQNIPRNVDKKQSSHETQTAKILICKHLKLAFSKFTQINQMKEDQLIKFSKNQSNPEKQRMKKLSHLYNQQPIFELPDISDITLFNSKINQQVFLNKQIQIVETKSDQFVYKTQFQLMCKPKKIQHESINFTENKYISMELKKSCPIYGKQEQDISSERIKKTPSCTNIILQKRNSTQNIHKESSTVKKTIDIFSRKSSAENLYQGDKKQYETLKIPKKLSALKQLTLKQNQATSQQFSKLQFYQCKHSPRFQLKNTQKEKKCITVRIPQEQFKKTKTQHSNHKQTNYLNHKQNFITACSQRKLEKKVSISSFLHKGSMNEQKRHIKSIVRSVGPHRCYVQEKKYKYKSNNKENILTQSFTKRVNTKQKNQECSEFNTVNPIQFKLNDIKAKDNTFQTVLSKNMRNFKKWDTEELSIHEPIFQHIEMIQQNEGHVTEHSNQQLVDNYCVVQSVQLSKDKKCSTHKSIKLRSKLEKLQMNTARKMKLQIESMISQRKKTSFCHLKF